MSNVRIAASVLRFMTTGIMTVALIGAGYGLIWLAERLRDAIHGGMR